MDDLIKYNKDDTPFSLAEKITRETGGILPVQIAFEDSNLARAIIENSPLKNSDKGVADWITEGLILSEISPGNFKILEDNLNADKNQPYSLTLIYEKFK